MLAMGAVLRRPEVVMGTYGSEGSGGQGVSGFVSNVLLRGGPKSELLCGGQCGAAAACVLPVRLSTAMRAAVLCCAVLSAAAWLPAPCCRSFRVSGSLQGRVEKKDGTRIFVFGCEGRPSIADCVASQVVSRVKPSDLISYLILSIRSNCHLELWTTPTDLCRMHALRCAALRCAALGGCPSLSRQPVEPWFKKREGGVSPVW